jgi:transcriptional regulator with XRE-family HTH domain
VGRTIHSPEQRSLIALLRELRQESGVSQTELAKRLGRPQSFVSKYEAGERRLDLVELALICDALGANLVELVRRFEVGRAGDIRAGSGEPRRLGSRAARTDPSGADGTRK